MTNQEIYVNIYYNYFGDFSAFVSLRIRDCVVYQSVDK